MRSEGSGHRIDAPSWAGRLAAGLVLLGALGSAGGCGRGTDDSEPLRPDEAAILVLVTMDGVRLHELLHGPQSERTRGRSVDGRSAMPFLTQELAARGAFLGDPRAGSRVGLGSPLGTSLPSYQALLVGRWTLCLNNQCDPPASDTLLHRIRAAWRLPRERLAVFGTWERLCAGTGADEVADAVCGPRAIAARWQARLGPAAAAIGLSAPASTDRAAFELALERLREGAARVVWLALDESDGAAHAGDYPGYLATLARYDDWLRAIDSEIARLEEEEGARVTLVVTTDHGRGRGEDWTEHRWNVPGTDELWLFVGGPGFTTQGASGGAGDYSLLDVRPTVEHLMGLPPTTGPCRGRVIDAARPARSSGTPP